MAVEAQAGHPVQRYETDAFPSRRVVDHLSAGLANTDGGLVIATQPHWEVVRAELAERGHDVADAIHHRRLVMLDARETLDLLIADDTPDRAAFDDIIGGAVREVAGASGRVHAFSEMVDLLWRDGRQHAAAQLETLWNDLARQHDLDLLRAYPIEELARRSVVETELRASMETLVAASEEERTRSARILQLQQATSELASAITLGEVTDTIVSAAARLVGAGSTVVYLADADGRFRLFGMHDLPSADDRWSLLALDTPRPLASAIATARPVWVETREQLIAEYPEVAETMRTMQAAAALPLVQAGRVIGGVGLSFETGRRFSDDEKRWLESFATQCTLAIERARRYGAELEARQQAETLQRIAESLNSDLDFEAVLQKVSDEATALVGAEYGAFVYDVRNDRGTYAIVATTGAKEEALAKLRIARAAPLFAFTPGSVRVDDVRGDARFAQLPWCDPEPRGHRPIASFLAVPVRSRKGTVMGGLFFGHTERAKFTAQHEHALRALATTAAIAVDNAELYRASREAEDAQRATVAQLVETIRMNELFTGVLAHDLRSPLAAIVTASEFLQLKLSGGEKRMADRAQQSAHRMARMIEQLLDFTRIRLGGGLPIDPAPHDLRSIVSNVVDEVRAGHPAQHIEVTCDGDTHGRWDADRLAQALANLVGNAAIHGRPERAIAVRVDGSDPATVRVAITNAGAIADDTVSRLFEPFTRSERRRDGSRGLGLGLYIAREIAASHGGTLAAASAGDTTTFTLALPRTVTAARARQPTQRSLAPAPVPDGDQRMRMLVDGIRDCAIFLLDADARITSWTRAAEHVTGWDRDTIVQQPLAVLYAPGSELLEIELGRAAKLGVSERDVWCQRQDGSKFWANVSLSAIRAPAGYLAGYAAIVRDRTEQHAAQQAREESESLAQLMMDCVRDYAIFMLDTEGRVRTWSRGAQLLKGYTAGEIVGKHIETFYTRQDRDAGRPQVLLARAVEDGRVEDEGWRVRADGSRFWADVVITALRDHDGELRGFVKVTRDLTDRRRAEEELRRSEERFRLLVDAVKDYAIYLLDASGHVMTWNAGAERTKGYRAEEIIGTHFSKFYTPEDVRAGTCERELEVAAREGRVEDEGWRVRKDGTRFWANIVITPLRSSTGELVAFAKITRDLTERKKLEEARIRTIQAQEGIRLRDEFLSIVSHELKTPLAGLLLQIEAITARAGLDDKTREKLGRARESGERLDDLIEMLLDVSRIATGRFVLATARFDLAAVTREIVDSFRPSAHKAGCELRLEAPAELVGNWDRVRIGQVIANLLSNAVKYGAGHPIDVRLTRSGSEAVLEVHDHGPGVDPTIRSQVFDRFVRAASTLHHGGLGIGLYVVHEIVTAHGGRATVEDSPEGGARFMIRIPMEST